MAEKFLGKTKVKEEEKVGHGDFSPIILATQEAEIESIDL
jgi:hypothetical protein